MNPEDKIKDMGSEHVHDYFGRTSVDLGHFHTFTGSTGVQTFEASGHVHSFANDTRVARNHTHRMFGTSSIQMPTPMVAGHVHQIQGKTSEEEGHTHTFDVYTGYERPPRNVRRRLARALSTDQPDTEEKPKRKLRSPFRRRLSDEKQ